MGSKPHARRAESVATWYHMDSRTLDDQSDRAKLWLFGYLAKIRPRRRETSRSQSRCLISGRHGVATDTYVDVSRESMKR